MAQGNKLSKAKTNIAKKSTTTKRKSSGPARGARVIAPKKANLIKQAKLTQKLTAKINRKTETAFAAKASSFGRLTLMKNVAEEEKEKIKNEDKAKAKSKK